LQSLTADQRPQPAKILPSYNIAAVNGRLLAVIWFKLKSDVFNKKNTPCQ
jgi:hypothetical protein